MTEPLSERQAAEAYRAVCAALGVEPHTSDATDDRGRAKAVGSGMVVRQGEGRWPNAPVLCHNFEGWHTTTTWAVVWEEGPYDWAMWIPHGGEGFPPAELARDIFAEPINGWALGLYRA